MRYCADIYRNSYHVDMLADDQTDVVVSDRECRQPRWFRFGFASLTAGTVEFELGRFQDWFKSIAQGFHISHYRMWLVLNMPAKRMFFTVYGQ